jgi:hypothetical protein
MDPDENVGALEHHGHVVVGTVSIEWPSPAPPPDFVLCDPVHVPPPVDLERLSAAIDRARAAGVARRRTCRFCGNSFNPGRMHAGDVCQGCAERHLGVVH